MLPGNIQTYGLDLRIHIRDNNGVISIKNIQLDDDCIDRDLIKQELDNPNQKIVAVVIPEGVLHIGEAAFFSCKDLEKIVLPTTLIRIEANAFTNCENLDIVDFGSSGDCEKLKEFVPGSLFPLYIEKEVFAGCKNLGYEQIKMLGNIDINSAIENTPSEKLPDNFEVASPNTETKEIANLSNVEKIESLAFWGCEKLNEIHVKSSTEIADNAFADCKNLKQKCLVDTEIEEGMSNPTFQLRDIPDLFMIQTTNGKELKIPYLNQLPYFSRYALLCHCLLQCNGNLDPEKLYTLNTTELWDLLLNVMTKEALCPYYSCYFNFREPCLDSAREIDQEYINLKKEFLDSISVINYEGNIDIIEEGMFSSCTNLNSIIFPQMLKIIGYYAFAECKSLISITIPDSVQLLGVYIFRNCTALRKAYIPRHTIYAEDVNHGYAEWFMDCTVLTCLSISNDNVYVVDRKIDLLKFLSYMGIFKVYVKRFSIFRPKSEEEFEKTDRYYHGRYELEAIVGHYYDKNMIYKLSVNLSLFTLIIGIENNIHG